MTAHDHAHDLATRVVAANDRLASAAQEIAKLRTDLAEARATIRRLEMRLALATSRVTPWIYRPDLWRDELSARQAARELVLNHEPRIGLGDGTPEQEQPTLE